MAKKGATKAKEEPLKLFYIFYSQERWDNWIKTLQEANFEVDETGNEMPEGLSLLYKFTEDITISVLKIIRLYQIKKSLILAFCAFFLLKTKDIFTNTSFDNLFQPIKCPSAYK